jgi:PleD family two-component response regulator
VLPQIELAEAVAATERSRQAVVHLVTLEGQPVTLSCGVTACFTSDVIKTLVQRADDALYEAKETGRNKVVSSKEDSKLKIEN